MYTESELVAIAKRENNNKRKYLVVNRLQGKHIPASPDNTLKMFNSLADILRNEYPNESLLIVGFAETATAIGSALAINLGTGYIQTTRENMGNVEYIYFTESHSHATEQKLVREDMEKAIANADRIVFAEDEITTGNTILKIVDILKKDYGANLKFSAISILNGMDNESYDVYIKRKIGVHYLVKTEHSRYTSIAESYSENGEYINVNTNTPDLKVNTMKIYGKSDARRYINGKDYSKACDSLWKKIESRKEILNGNKILVIGTEEFMYPAIYVAKQIENLGFEVKCHSTTRSPIAVCSDSNYPLHRRFELRSLYDDERTTYIYDIEKYDTVIIITDSENKSEKGLNTLINAVNSCKNENIHLVKWISA